MQYCCEGGRERNGATGEVKVAPIYEGGEVEENFLWFNNAFLSVRQSDICLETQRALWKVKPCFMLNFDDLFALRWQPATIPGVCAPGLRHPRRPRSEPLDKWIAAEILGDCGSSPRSVWDGKKKKSLDEKGTSSNRLWQMGTCKCSASSGSIYQK